MKNFIKSTSIALMIFCVFVRCEDEPQSLTKEEKEAALEASVVEETTGDLLAIHKADNNIELSFWETGSGNVTVVFTYGVEANESQIYRYNSLLNELAEEKKTYREVYEEVAGKNANRKYLGLLRDAEPRIRKSVEEFKEITKRTVMPKFPEIDPFAEAEASENKREMAATCGTLGGDNKAAWFTTNMCDAGSSSNMSNPDLVPMWENCWINQTRATANPYRLKAPALKFFRAWGMAANNQNSAILRVERYDPSHNPGNGYGLVMNMTLPPGVVGSVQQTNFICYADIQAGDGCLVHLAALRAPSYAQ